MTIFKRRSPEQAPPEPPLEVAPSLPLPIAPEARPAPEQIRMVGELSVEYLQYLRERFHQQNGKFVRVGDVILLSAPYIPGTGGREEVPHLNMIKFASDDAELAQKIVTAKLAESTTAGKFLHKEAVRDGVADAGRFDFTTDDSGQVESLRVFGASGDYGIADETGRNETLKVAAQRLGSSIEVIWGDPH